MKKDVQCEVKYSFDCSLEKERGTYKIRVFRDNFFDIQLNPAIQFDENQL